MALAEAATQRERSAQRRRRLVAAHRASRKRGGTAARARERSAQEAAHLGPLYSHQYHLDLDEIAHRSLTRPIEPTRRRPPHRNSLHCGTRDLRIDALPSRRLASRDTIVASCESRRDDYGERGDARKRTAGQCRSRRYWGHVGQGVGRYDPGPFLFSFCFSLHVFGVVPEGEIPSKRELERRNSPMFGQHTGLHRGRGRRGCVGVRFRPSPQIRGGSESHQPA